MSEGDEERGSLVVVAAGRGARLRETLERRAGGDGDLGAVPNKAFFPVAGRPLLHWTLEALAAAGPLELIVVLHADDAADEELVAGLTECGASAVTVGGARRQDSVLAGIGACGGGPERLVGVHDAARPLVSPEDVRRVFRAAAESGAAILASRARDTIKRAIRERGKTRIDTTLPRDTIWLAGTPQVARRGLLEEALRAAGGECTDEAMALEALKRARAEGELEIALVEAEGWNPKLTTAADIAPIARELVDRRRRAAAMTGRVPAGVVRVGHGTDLHRLVAGRPLVLGGVEVPFDKGPLGHSDGDVVLHAVVDAMLGAAGLGDIGELFPDDDPANKDRASREFVEEARRQVEAVGLEVTQADITIHAERPKLKPFKAAIRRAVEGLLGLGGSDPAAVTIKAKTNEGLDAVGRGEAIAATATLTLVGVARHDHPAPKPADRG